MDRYERVETIEINRGDKGETKLKIKNKSTVLCSLSLTSALKKEDYYIIPYILYNIYHVTAVHLPSITRIGIIEAKKKKNERHTYI